MKEALTLICRVRFSPSQWSKVEEHARSCGLQPSTYVRTTVLGTVPRKRRRAKENNVVYHLNRIGNNLNQLARRRNADEPVAQSEILTALEELRAALRRI